MLCRLVCVVPGAMMYDDIHIRITHGAQFIGLLEQHFPSAPEFLLLQFLKAPPSGCVTLGQMRRTGPDSEIW